MRFPGTSWPWPMRSEGPGSRKCLGNGASVPRLHPELGHKGARPSAQAHSYHLRAHSRGLLEARRKPRQAQPPLVTDHLQNVQGRSGSWDLTARSAVSSGFSIFPEIDVPPNCYPSATRLFLKDKLVGSTGKPKLTFRPVGHAPFVNARCNPSPNISAEVTFIILGQFGAV